MPLLEEQGLSTLITKTIKLSVAGGDYKTPTSMLDFYPPELDVWSADGTPVTTIAIDEGRASETPYYTYRRRGGDPPQVLCPIDAPGDGAQSVAAMAKAGPER
ncbi:hypothetical protein ABGB17_19730 [Sphaerisporangium sp. B11E5]|uniref:hypothetical protein n=1 Tax=Sphaerisporangium sp. B11E5 TaxID=3153563 RepID=UPI00325F6BBE